MPVLPALQSLFDVINAPKATAADIPIARLREVTHAALETHIVSFYEDVAPLAIEQDYQIAVPGGTITVRIYSPNVGDQALPCHLYLHGGGFWLGKLDHFDALCRGFARDTRCVVASVGYRLAPEYKFPAAAEDSYAALLWVRENAPGIGVDPARISIGGVSAGGNLAAVVCLMGRDRGVPLPVLQILEVPVLDLSDWTPFSVPSEGIHLSSGKDVYCEHYLTDGAQAALPYVSPLRAPDLSGFPPAVILCAEYDPLAAEGQAYAQRLIEAGVPCEHHLCEGQFHGAQPLIKLIPREAAAYHATIVDALRRAYSPKSGE